MGLHPRIERADLECSVGDCAGLANELIEPLIGNTRWPSESISDPWLSPARDHSFRRGMPAALGSRRQNRQDTRAGYGQDTATIGENKEQH